MPVPQQQPGMPPQGPQYSMRGMSPQFRQSMPPHGGLLAPKQSMGGPRYPTGPPGRFPQPIRQRMQMCKFTYFLPRFKILYRKEISQQNINMSSADVLLRVCNPQARKTCM